MLSLVGSQCANSRILRAARNFARLQQICSAQNRSTHSAQHAARIHATSHDFNESDLRKNNPKKASLGQTNCLLPRERFGVDFHDLPRELRRVVIRVVVLHANVDQEGHALQVLPQLVLLTGAHVIDGFGLHAEQ